MGKVIKILLLQFKKISQAYEILSDEKKRSTYDEDGEEGLKDGGRGKFKTSRDIFDMFFGGGGGGKGRREKSTKDMVHPLGVSDLYKHF